MRALCQSVTRAVGRRVIHFVAFAAVAVSAATAGAETIAGRIAIDFGGSQICLGVMGEPQSGVETTTVACDSAPNWSIGSWSKALSSFRIAFGTGGDSGPVSTNLCLDVDTAHPTEGEKVGLYLCHPSTSVNQRWAWPTPQDGERPDGAANLASSSPQKCLAPAQEGAQLYVVACNPATQRWYMLPAAVQPAQSQMFEAPGTFTAPKAGRYRVLAIGGGGGGAFDEGAGAGSGYVVYQEIQLAKDQAVTVTVGAGGAIGTNANKAGLDGQATTFGTLLTAAGGKGGPGSNLPGGDGGSGGGGDPNGSRQSQTGGSDGSDGTNTGAGGGTGQGAQAFSGSFGNFVTVQLTSGAGGSTNTPNGSGGGGGGGLVVGDQTQVSAGPNQADFANGGQGYGSGGAGGSGRGAMGIRGGSPGEGGFLIVEWN